MRPGFSRCIALVTPMPRCTEKARKAADVFQLRRLQSGWRLRAGRMWVVLVLVASGVVVATATKADAAPCPSPAVSAKFASAWWFPAGSNAAYGVRAPIRLRAGATLCGSYTDGDSVGSWIAIEPGNFTRISQMGFVYLHNAQQVQQLCRFWAASAAGTVHAYKCSDDTPGDHVYFRIRTLLGPSSNYYYELADCGTSSSYSGCTVKNTSENAYSNPVSLVSGEANRGGCTDHIQGSASAKVTYGTGSDPLQAQNAYGGGWSTRDYVADSPDCGNFNVNVSSDNSVVTTWDDRN